MKVSLITSCYNSSGVIPDNLESVREQVGNFELEHVIQDGGSTDGSLKQLEAYRQSVDYDVSIQSGPDEGFYDAINKAIGRSSGAVIGLLNADDWYASNEVLQTVVEAFDNNPELEVVYGDMDFVEEFEGEAVDGFKVIRRWRPGQFTPRQFRRGWMPTHPTVYVRKCVFDRLGGYRLDMASAADYEWLLRLFMGSEQVGKTLKPADEKTIKHVPKVMVNMRMGGMSNASLKNRLLANKMDRRAWRINALKPAFGFRLLKPLRKILQWF